ncbi:hypothetical protein B0T18DRAFT_484853 [Schizothecium vesticola]|uniref:Uncharacterized protein n=1 Tax=Schizothecium vesticola TaxID=314040 RepID=A0AA40FAQ2_9PEZI|nr:hypothetical protein B0T18DRAFT_484853 [Schizothecium vesticola]
MRPMEVQPRPTPSASLREDLGGGTTSNLWLNPHTCAWGPNPDVGCASGTSTASAFPTTCVDGSQITISEFTSSSWHKETAVCIDATAPACATLLFPGDPAASQFRCQPTATVITLLPVPWDVAATQELSTFFPAGTSTGDGALFTETSPPPSNAESTSEHPLATSKTSPTTVPKASTPSASNTGAIAGGVVGGIALLLLLPLFCYLFRKNYPKKSTAGQQPRAAGPDDGAGAEWRGRESVYNPQYIQGRGSGNSPKHIPIELTGYNPRDYGPGGSGPSVGPGFGPAHLQRQETEGFGLGSVYMDGNGEHQPRRSMETVTEESGAGSSRSGQSSAMGRAGMEAASGIGGIGGAGVDKGKGKVDAGDFSHTARVSDASSRYSEEGMGWKR